MTTWLYDFLFPYYALAKTGSYALMQNFQAMGWASIWQGPYMDLGIINVVTGAGLLLLPLIALLNVLAAWVLSARLAILLALAWLVPGLLSVTGLYIITPVVPDAYIIGSGGRDQLGSVEGALVSSIVIMLVGWSLSTLVLHTFRAGKKSKSLFDHLWYMLGLTAVVFYVADGGLRSHADKVVEHERQLANGFALLEPQLSNVSSRCLDQVFVEAHAVLCAWASKARPFMREASEGNWVARKYLEAPSASRLLGLLRSQGVGEQQVTEAIRAYNSEFCSGNRKHLDCQRIPLELNRHPGLLGNSAGLFDEYVLALEGVVPTIEYHWETELKAREKLERRRVSINERWAYLALLFPLFMGIKVSHASRELFGGTEAPVLRTGFKALWRASIRGVLMSASALARALAFMARCIGRLTARRS